MKPIGTKSVREAALLLETSERRVLEMIAEKQIRAINTSNGKKRPRWAILIESIESFGRKEKTPPSLNVPQHV
jgi:excisionase family DNA binding protein